MQNRVNNKDVVTDVFSLSSSNIGVGHAIINDSILVSVDQLHQDGAENADNEDSSLRL